jgi:glycosyltransferase involved in cell wall biosynthesis
LVGGAALVCPSYRESLGRVLFEAWDAGLVPVVWSGSGGAAEAVLASGGGLTYAAQDGASLAQTLRTLLSLAPDARVALIEAGRAWLRSNCDVTAHAGRMMHLFEDARSL